MKLVARPIAMPLARVLTDAPLSSDAPGPEGDDGFLLENDTDFLLLESGDYLLTEA